MTPSIRPLVALALCAPLMACPPPNVNTSRAQSAVVLPVKPSVFLRAAPDADATHLIGQFLPDDVVDGDLDESQGARTECSDFIKPRVIDAGGTYEEIFGASNSIGGSIGYNNIASVKGERSTMSAVRARYDAVRKVVADVDARGLAECCRQEPGACTQRYISSAIMGSGKIYVATESAHQLGVGAANIPNVPVTGDVLYKDGLKWESTRTFTAQYFAFGLSRTGQPAADTTTAAAGGADCSWAKRVPRSNDGVYFVGLSDPMPSERVARDFAMKNAREQVVKYLGEHLAADQVTQQKLSGQIGDLQAQFEDTQTVDAIAQGIARFVKDERWCEPAERIDSPRGTQYTTRVLAYFPNSEIRSASVIQLTNLKETLKARGKLSAAQEAAIQAAIDAQR